MHKAECDFLVKEAVVDAKFADKIDEVYGKDIIPEIESIRQITKGSTLITSTEAKQIEAMFAE